MAKKVTFEQSMLKLEQIVHKLESGDMTLEQSMVLFEEGTKLSLSLSKQLDEAESKVAVLMKGNDEVLVEKEFDVNDD